MRLHCISIAVETCHASTADQRQNMYALIWGDPQMTQSQLWTWALSTTGIVPVNHESQMLADCSCRHCMNVKPSAISNRSHVSTARLDRQSHLPTWIFPLFFSSPAGNYIMTSGTCFEGTVWTKYTKVHTCFMKAGKHLHIQDLISNQFPIRFPC